MWDASVVVCGCSCTVSHVFVCRVCVRRVCACRVCGSCWCGVVCVPNLNQWTRGKRAKEKESVKRDENGWENEKKKLMDSLKVRDNKSE